MDFNGKYEIESQENYDEFLKKIGIPDDIIEKGRNFKIVTEVIQNGNEFTWSQVYPGKTMTNKFVIDQESEMETMAGKKFKATVTLEGGKITVRFPNYQHTAEISGGKLVEATVTLEGGKITVRFPNYQHTAEISGGKLVECPIYRFVGLQYSQCRIYRFMGFQYSQCPIYRFMGFQYSQCPIYRFMGFQYSQCRINRVMGL
ncbi:UNVERIFIED_CONTAM: hypothetical protein FKN15_026869 [Acipenser sinensis]